MVRVQKWGELEPESGGRSCARFQFQIWGTETTAAKTQRWDQCFVIFICWILL